MPRIRKKRLKGKTKVDKKKKGGVRKAETHCSWWVKNKHLDFPATYIPYLAELRFCTENEKEKKNG